MEGKQFEYKQLIKFINNLDAKYTRQKLLQYAAFHLAYSSTPIAKEIKFFDLEGEDSIVNFVNKLVG